MKKELHQTIRSPQPARRRGANRQDGYPSYPAVEDIFAKDKEEVSIDPEDISRTKSVKEIEMPGGNNEKDFEEDMSGSDLDVPGSEGDDGEEGNGKEDEENNFYSLGGDNHNNLEEDQGE
jgi:hypothetical protein